MNHSSLIRTGLENARRNGVKLGRPSKQTDEIRAEAKKLREQGLSYRKIHAALTESGHSLSLGTTAKIVRNL